MDTRHICASIILCVFKGNLECRSCKYVVGALVGLDVGDGELGGTVGDEEGAVVVGTDEGATVVGAGVGMGVGKREGNVDGCAVGNLY